MSVESNPPEPIDLDAIEARASAASPGPWQRGNRIGGPATELDDAQVYGPEMTIYDEGGHGWEDAEFIAHARTDVPALVAEVRRLRKWLALAMTQSLGEDCPECEASTGRCVIHALG